MASRVSFMIGLTRLSLDVIGKGIRHTSCLFFFLFFSFSSFIFLFLFYFYFLSARIEHFPSCRPECHLHPCPRPPSPSLYCFLAGIGEQSSIIDGGAVRSCRKGGGCLHFLLALTIYRAAGCSRDYVYPVPLLRPVRVCVVLRVVVW